MQLCCNLSELGAPAEPHMGNTHIDCVSQIAYPGDREHYYCTGTKRD